MSFIKEFRDFAVKGNAVDMAVGVIIGGAFGKIITSIVNDLIMPPIGWLIGGMNFKDLAIKLGEQVGEDGTMVPINFAYGNFIQTTIDFLIVAFCVFLLVKTINKLKDTVSKDNVAEEETTAPAEPSAEEKLLTEIRDLLKNK